MIDATSLRHSEPKDQLQKVIKDVVARIARYRGSVFNEQDTKAALIEPILEALGWDTRDPEQVRREFKSNPKDNPVDYALLHMRQPRLMVEAKGLGEALDDQKWVGQMLGYAAVGGALWCVLTNGEEYRIYNATAPVAAADKLLCKMRLTSSPIEEMTLLLSLIARANLGENRIEVLWKTQHIDRKVGAVLQEAFATPDRRLVALVRSRESGLAPKDVLNSLRRLVVRVEQPPLQFPTGRAKSPKGTPSVPQAARTKKPRAGESRRTFGVDLATLIGAGLLTPPLRLYRRYKGKVLEARLLPDGQVEFGGKVYRSCSTAAEEARGSITGRRMNTNGWSFWQFDAGPGKPTTLETVRAGYLASRQPPAGS
jgi:predicted type IV restriction endonuclease